MFSSTTQPLCPLWYLLPFFCTKETILLHLPQYEGQQLPSIYIFYKSYVPIVLISIICKLN